MVSAVRKHKSWLIPLCLSLMAVGIFFGWQLHAQEAPPSPGMDPAMVGAPATADMQPAAETTATAPASADDLTLGLKSMLPSNIKVMSIKNWDGTTTKLLRFKYKLIDGRVITVHLPATYETEQMTKCCWESCFQTFAMDYEARLDAIEKYRSPDVSGYSGQIANQIRGYIPENFIINAIANDAPSASGMGSSDMMGPQMGTSPYAPAMGAARSGLPSMGAQLPPMPVGRMGMPGT